MNKLMYRFVYTTKKKKRNRPVFRHGMPPQGIPRKKQDACYTGITRDARTDSFIPTVCFAD